MFASPPLQLAPVFAHTYLPGPGAGGILEARIARGVVCIAHDILPQLVQAVQSMFESNVLREPALHIHNIAEEGALEI